MKLFLYVKILVLIFINSLLFAASLSGTVIIDNNDHVFNFNGKTIIIEDAGNTFGSVTVTSTGSFVFPKTVSDNKNHAYSLKLTQLPDNNGYICTINQASGTVFIHDKTDLVVSCKGKYYVSVNVSGLSNGDTYTLTYNNQTLSINTSSTQTFPQWFYTNSTYSFNPTFNYTTSNYKRCSNITNGTITNNLTIYIVCNISTFNEVYFQPKSRYGSVSWKDGSGNAYVFGGYNGTSYFNDLWMFNGTSWSQVTNAGTPPSVRFGAVAWTDNTGNAYVFGGKYSTYFLNDLWRFDGTWSPVTNTDRGLGTPSRRDGAVSWKDSSGNAYVFGGDNGDYLNDLWMFNGTSWSPVTNTNGGLGTPSLRSAAVSWTDNAGNAYVFGGYNGSSFLNDLWKFNGTIWSPVTNAGTPPDRRIKAVLWKDSSGNVYVFGGYSGTSFLNDLWMFNGTSWSEVTNAGTPPSARDGAVAWKDNAGNAYVFGGDNGNYLNDLWKFTTNNTTWTQLTNVTNAPSVRRGAVAWKDNAGNAYVFGGYNGTYLHDLWRFNGKNIWSPVTNAGTPPSVRFGAVSWTDNAGNAYVFGGSNSTYFLNDLWKFNGTIWFPVTNTDGGLGTPSARFGAVSWTDNAGNAYVFGGYNGISYLNDLWKFNGTWSPVNNTDRGLGTPSVRSQAVAWTDNAGNAYVFGGFNGISLNDLWKFNGTSWSQVTNAGTPPSIRSQAVSWTDNAGNAYVFGGYNDISYLNDLWRFNGTRWYPVTNAGTPPSVRNAAVSWTDNAGNAYVFGGTNDNYLNDLYVIK